MFIFTVELTQSEVFQFAVTDAVVIFKYYAMIYIFRLPDDWCKINHIHGRTNDLSLDFFNSNDIYMIKINTKLSNLRTHVKYFRTHSVHRDVILVVKLDSCKMISYWRTQVGQRTPPPPPEKQANKQTKKKKANPPKTKNRKSIKTNNNKKMKKVTIVLVP